MCDIEDKWVSSHYFIGCDTNEIKNSSCESNVVQFEQQSGLIKNKINVDVVWFKKMCNLVGNRSTILL